MRGEGERDECKERVGIGKEADDWAAEDGREDEHCFRF